ncbi:MAG: thiamine pyrophosphate-binding protein, partial [Acidobacteria bacterium]|nr:thiamine pyrophosphate-binding protein [Acidobacteriota bacterium]
MATHAEVIAAALAGSGVEYSFGVPGGEVLALIDACRRAGIRFVLAGHESSAAVMAQVLGQIRGVPGVCLATLGPGATNLVTGVANAFLDRAPLLAFTAQIPGAALATMSHQRVDLNQLFAPVTKRSVPLGTETDSGEAVRDSIKLALAPRPGPVHLALPSDLALQECNGRPAAADTAAAGPGAAGTLAEIAARIHAARRPLALIGLGAEPATAAAVRTLLERLEVPFLVTPKVKGLIPENHPRFLGVATGMAIDRDIVETVRAADLILGLGFDPVEADKTWFADVPVVALDSAPMSEGDYRPLEAIGDIATLAAALAAMVEPHPWPEELHAARRTAATRAAGPGLSP